jgi:predicted ATP-dependent endonuclease of OLD family
MARRAAYQTRYHNKAAIYIVLGTVLVFAVVLLINCHSLNEKKERLTNIIEVEKKNYRSAKLDGDVLFETSIVTALDRVSENAMIEYINGMRMQILTQNPRGYSQRTKNTGYAQILDKIKDHYLDALSISSIEYMETHNASQKTLYTLDDRNDVTATIIHEWMQQQINPGDEEYRFIVKWMQELKIGQGFKIDNHFGEAYSVNIVYGKDSNGPQSALSELGKGAIQMMTLLLYISSMMRKYKGKNVKPLIAFEEPEQNKHPNWQSHLADIFEEVRQKGFRILVETHSEYMIRKSQVQVAQMQFADQDVLNDNCPISTYDFPTEEKPYKMKYRTAGNFENDFDTGFYDVAADLAFKTF